MTIDERFWRKVPLRPDVGCWLYMGGLDFDGYGQFWTKQKQRCDKAHRVAWELCNSTIPDGLMVCHHCDTPQCVRPSHLFLGTPKENMLDMVKKGRNRVPRGAAHHWARLDETRVMDIRERYARGGISQKQLAREFGIGQTTVSHLVRRDAWKHLPSPRNETEPP